MTESTIWETSWSCTLLTSASLCDCDVSVGLLGAWDSVDGSGGIWGCCVLLTACFRMRHPGAAGLKNTSWISLVVCSLIEIISNCKSAIMVGWKVQPIPLAIGTGLWQCMQLNARAANDLPIILAVASWRLYRNIFPGNIFWVTITAKQLKCKQWWHPQSNCTIPLIKSAILSHPSYTGVFLSLSSPSCNFSAAFFTLLLNLDRVSWRGSMQIMQAPVPLPVISGLEGVSLISTDVLPFVSIWSTIPSRALLGSVRNRAFRFSC